MRCDEVPIVILGPDPILSRDRTIAMLVVQVLPLVRLAAKELWEARLRITNATGHRQTGDPGLPGTVGYG